MATKPVDKDTTRRRRQEQAKRTRQNAEKKIEAFVRFAVESGRPVRFISDAGQGKTSYVKWACQKMGYAAVYMSLATLSPEDLAVVAPTRTQRSFKQPDGSYEVETIMELETLMFEDLSNDLPKIVILDEFSRCDKRTMAAVMSLINEGSINGKKVPNLITIIALDNPDNGQYMVSTADHAQATRFAAHVYLTANDIPWREALVRKYENRFSEDVLEKVFQTWEGFSSSIKKTISPRVLDFMISNASDGVPLRWALGVEGLKTYPVLDDAGVDVTEHVLSQLVAAIGGGGDRPMEYPALEALASAVRRAEHGERCNVRLVGHAGFAKTAFTVAYLTKVYGKEGVVPFSLATTSPENWGVPVPVVVTNDGAEELTDEERDENVVRQLQFLLYSRFNDDVPKVLLFDEFARAGKRTLNAVMEIVNEGTLNGQPIRGLQFVVALDNPAGKKGEFGANIVYATEKLDRAQATRFAMTLGLQPQDIPWMPFLREKYGEAAEPFLGWWAGNLDETGKIQAHARMLDHMIQLHTFGLDIENALPTRDGEHREGPDLTNLKASLRGARSVTLQTLVDELEEYCSIFEEGESHPFYYERWAEVSNLLELITDVNTLDRYRDTIKQVSVLMGAQWKTSSVAAVMENAPVLQWWSNLWKEVWREKRAAKADDA